MAFSKILKFNENFYEFEYYFDDNDELWVRSNIISYFGYVNINRIVKIYVDRDNWTIWKKLIETNTVELEPFQNISPTTIFVNKNGLNQICDGLKFKLKNMKSWFQNKVIAELDNEIVPDKEKIALLTYELEEAREEIKELYVLVEKFSENNLELYNALLSLSKKIAVFPQDINLCHSLKIMQKIDNVNSFKFIRCQNRRMKRAVSINKPEYQEIFHVYNIPSHMNILNIIKETLKAKNSKYKAKHNEIETDCDVVDLVQQLVYKTSCKTAFLDSRFLTSPS